MLIVPEEIRQSIFFLKKNYVLFSTHRVFIILPGKAILAKQRSSILVPGSRVSSMHLSVPENMI